MLRLWGFRIALDCALSSDELITVQELVAARGTLLVARGGVVDVRTDVGHFACEAFLDKVDAASRILAVPVASRQYRAGFSANYRMLFPTSVSGRQYRLDVFDAATRLFRVTPSMGAEVWVNGKRFEFSVLAVQCAQDLEHCWVALLEFLEKLVIHDGRPGKPDQLLTLLANFDVAWAYFEKQYINELMNIEEESRDMVKRSVELEKQLPRTRDDVAVEAPPKTPEEKELERQFVKFICQLNSVANIHRKGRDDLGYDILEAARAELALAAPSRNDRRGTARALAKEVVTTYTALRTYFRKVDLVMEQVDPHLCNNHGLVARLVDWEETWEVASRFVKNKPMLDALCDLVDELKAAEQLVPELASMFEERAAELFMVLPRLVVLCFLDKPIEHRTQLVHHLLPHRFEPAPRHLPESRSYLLDPDFKAAYDKYKKVMTELTESFCQTHLSGSWRDARQGAWEALVRFAVLGCDAEVSSVPRQLRQLQGPELNAIEEGRRRMVAELLRNLEVWSLELQRHCPQDWNTVSAIFVHCMTGFQSRQSSDSSKELKTNFRV